jgi:hypothetical protein
MKKLLALSLAVLMILAMAIPAAAGSAFDKETFRVTDKKTLMWDNSAYNGGGAGGNPFCYAGNYGTGRNSYGDVAGYDDVDFGANGASKVTVNFGYHKQDPAADEPTTFAIYVDNIFGKPVANFSVAAGTTKGSEIVNHKEFTADVQVPGGKHSVYFVATNDKSGSFDWIQFTESDKKVTKMTYAKDEMKYEAGVSGFNAFKDMTINNKGFIFNYIWSARKDGAKWVDGNGIGYADMGDMVVYPNVDFGKKGAKSVTITFANGDAAKNCPLEVYIDDPLGEPAAKLECKPSGGWTLAKAAPTTADIKVPNGVHTVIVKYASDQSGSFTTMKFAEADEVIYTAEQLAEQEAAKQAAQTGDSTVALVALAAASLVGIAVVSKKRA